MTLILNILFVTFKSRATLTSDQHLLLKILIKL
jgi:hypothetical protein